MRRFVAIALLAFAPLAQAFDGAWTQVATVTLDATYIDEAPPIVPIYLSGFDSTWWAAVQADGDDIRVTEDDDTTERDYYLVSINTGTSLGLIIANVDGYASASVDKDLRIFAGNSGASAASDAAATFADYAAFYLPGMTTSNLANPGTYDLTAVNSPGTAASGFEGLTTATYTAASSQYHKYEGTIVSAWPISLDLITYPSVVTGTEVPAYMGSSADSSQFGWYRDSSNIYAAVMGNGGSAASVQTGTVSAGTNYILGNSRDGTTGTTKGYRNGTEYTNSTSINAVGTLNRLAVGAYLTTSPSLYWSGRVSLFSVSNKTRSADYFTTMYDAWFTSAFRTYGATEANAGGATGHPWYFWRYRA